MLKLSVPKVFPHVFLFPVKRTAKRGSQKKKEPEEDSITPKRLFIVCPSHPVRPHFFALVANRFTPEGPPK